MLIEWGLNGYGETHWATEIPAEHCSPGLEVGIIAKQKGIQVGNDLITWEEIDKAREFLRNAD
jgi:hypothetical protein